MEGPAAFTSWCVPCSCPLGFNIKLPLASGEAVRNPAHPQRVQADFGRLSRRVYCVCELCRPKSASPLCSPTGPPEIVRGSERPPRAEVLASFAPTFFPLYGRGLRNHPHGVPRPPLRQVFDLVPA